MAIIYECDRCHRQSREHSILQGVTIPGDPMLSNTPRYPLGREATTHSICDDCVRKLREWMQPLPRVRARAAGD